MVKTEFEINLIHFKDVLLLLLQNIVTKILKMLHLSFWSYGISADTNRISSAKNSITSTSSPKNCISANLDINHGSKTNNLEERMTFNRLQTNAR